MLSLRTTTTKVLHSSDEIDRRNLNGIYPSLDEMAQAALTALENATKNSSKGFFLMIEGSRIDHAGHGNDPAAQVHEVLAYDKTFASVVNFIDNSDDHNMLIATSDHETGGLSVARRKNLPPCYGTFNNTTYRAKIVSLSPL